MAISIASDQAGSVAQFKPLVGADMTDPVPAADVLLAGALADIAFG